MALFSGRAIQTSADKSIGRPQRNRITYLMDSEIGEQSLRLLVSHRRVNDHVITLLPVDGGCNAVLVPELK
jgi:hypothetical protein